MKRKEKCPPSLPMPSLYTVAKKPPNVPLSTRMAQNPLRFERRCRYTGISTSYWKDDTTKKEGFQFARSSPCHLPLGLLQLHQGLVSLFDFYLQLFHWKEKTFRWSFLNSLFLFFVSIETFNMYDKEYF